MRFLYGVHIKTRKERFYLHIPCRCAQFQARDSLPVPFSPSFRSNFKNRRTRPAPKLAMTVGNLTHPTVSVQYAFSPILRETRKNLSSSHGIRITARVFFKYRMSVHGCTARISNQSQRENGEAPNPGSRGSPTQLFYASTQDMLSSGNTPSFSTQHTREQIACPCSEPLQTIEHVLLECPSTQLHAVGSLLPVAGPERHPNSSPT